jgi:hypothetical protein
MSGDFNGIAVRDGKILVCVEEYASELTIDQALAAAQCLIHAARVLGSNPHGTYSVNDWPWPSAPSPKKDQ